MQTHVRVPETQGSSFRNAHPTIVSKSAKINNGTAIAPTNGHPKSESLEKAASGLIEAGLTFFESLAAAAISRESSGSSSGASTETKTRRITDALSGLFSRDVQTKKPVLSIPLPESVTEGRIAQAVAGLLSALQG